MKIRGVAVLLAAWMAVSGALLFSSVTFGAGRTDIEVLYGSIYERVVQVVREVERAARDVMGGGRRGGGRARDCSCL